MLALTSNSAVAPSPSIDHLEQELATLAAHLNAGNYRFLELLGEFERRGGHVGWGIASCAHWLQWKCGIGLVAAREKVRVARALRELPLIGDAMRRGVLSYCKVRALTRIATKENEAYLVQLAEIGTVSHVEKTVRLYRRTSRVEELAAANDQHAERGLRCYFDESGALVLEGRLDPVQGALVMKALQAAGETLREAERDSREALAEPPDRAMAAYPARMADAMGLLCESFIAHGAQPLAASDRHLVTVHIDEAVLRDDAAEGRSHLEDGPSLPAATVRRLCCDASLVALLQRADGSTLDVGRKTRATPTALRRALEARDHGCRFPGCTNKRFVDVHHIHHWSKGGKTKLGNLVMLCRRHHRFVHEYGFNVELKGSELQFTRPDGQPIPDVPTSERIDAAEGMEALKSAHERSGLAITARTGVPKWFGESMDYNEAVGALQWRQQVATARRGSAGVLE